ncbi:hypothetical protein [Polynucleobacter sp. AP-Reno-20A-A9]|uniref:hypothetical protein n=1 Tax=Polynucleobacter sp. AP-Reno-20A-A9 TaxID=2576925 RepID=UPI001C0B80D4|nr:hypothetical protein [Polynucleobacter sp. AP-Reno-20A-A9]MBU3629298.1 hypothetical protein [Polynucleobacter sp. AP-Reno-20A-A9]
MTMGYKTGGRQLGTPNKASNDLRKAITALIDGNIDKLSEWLDTVASGVRKVDLETGKQTHEYLVRPNPAKAFDMFMSAVEYAIPKLARTEIVEEAIDSGEANERAQVFSDLIDVLKRKRQEEI